MLTDSNSSFISNENIYNYNNNNNVYTKDIDNLSRIIYPVAPVPTPNSSIDMNLFNEKNINENYENNQSNKNNNNNHNYKNYIEDNVENYNNDDHSIRCNNNNFDNIEGNEIENNNIENYIAEDNNIKCENNENNEKKIILQQIKNEIFNDVWKNTVPMLRPFIDYLIEEDLLIKSSKENELSMCSSQCSRIYILNYESDEGCDSVYISDQPSKSQVKEIKSDEEDQFYIEKINKKNDILKVDQIYTLETDH
eukprot:jgi/Orpsp1_1/1186938/evm.model.d7180000054246.1